MDIAILNQFGISVALRSLAAFATCGTLGLMFGNRAIRWLQARFREPIKSISPTVVRLHQHKEQTPTMGGLFIVIGIAVGSLAFGDVHDVRVWIALCTVASFAVLGVVDDLVKLRTHRRGLSAGTKLTGQFAAALAIGFLLSTSDGDATLWTVGKAALVLVAMANAVNVTDGLDGLASGCGLIASFAITAVLLLTNAYELAVVSASLAGVLGAFLWFNRFPARVFMGDTGSQSIGALIGYLSFVSGADWIILVIGGVFVLEAASVMLQLASYKVREKRLFLCALLHHHFQFAGWSEPSIVRLFCAASFVLAIAGICLIPAALPASNAAESVGMHGNLSVVSRVQQLDANARSSMHYGNLHEHTDRK